MDLELIDAHIHLHKDVEKEKQALPLRGRRDRDRWGKAGTIAAYMDWEGVSHALSLNLFPAPVIRRALLAKIPAELSGPQRAEVELVDQVRDVAWQRP